MSDMITMTTLAIPATLHRTASIETPPPVGGTRAAEDGPTEYRVRIALSSDKPYRRWFGDEVLGHGVGEIDTSRMVAGAPALIDHDNRTDSVVGRLENHSIDADGVMRADVVFDPEHEPAMRLYQRIARGFVKDVSVGYSVSRWQVTEREGGVDEYRAIRWTPLEASFVAVPAQSAAESVGVNRDAGGTALVSVPVTRATAPAREARSTIVSDKQTTVAPEAIPQPAVPAQSREAELAEIAALSNRGADLLAWIASGRSVADIRAEVIAAQRQANAAPTAISGVHDRGEDKPWESPGEFFRAVIQTVQNNGYTTDVRMKAARNQDTISGEEGGFVVPVAVSRVLLEATMTGGEILSRVSSRPVTVGNSYSETVVKEEARTTGSRNGGVRHAWLAEQGDYSNSTATTRQVEAKLAKLGALVTLTEEQMQDGPAMEAFLNEQVPEELRFGAESAIWEGDGVAKPLGAITSGALVTQAIEGTQTIANTAGFLWVNAAKMYARMPSRMLAGSAWFINAELWSKVLTATAGTAGGSHPMFTAPGALAGFPNGAIYGRPIIPIEYASAEGTVGDFVLANFSDYLFISKGSIRSQSSIHVDFVRDRTLLKFTWRCNGLPRTRVPLTPFKGANTMSPYIALAARS